MAKDQSGSEPAHHPDQDDLAEEGQIDDDGGFVEDDEDEPGEDHGHPAAEEVDDENEEEEGEDTSGTGGTNDDEEEDEETAQITNELLEAQTLQAMAQSRSAERRRQHASPRRGPVIGGSGGSPDDDPDDDEVPGTNPDPDPRGPNPAPANRRRPARNPLAPVAPFGSEAQCIPGRAQPRILIQADVDPWISEELDNKTLAAMRIQALFPVLPIQLGWIFPYFELAEDRPQVADTDFCWELITENNVRALLATRPWEVLENSDGAISFETDVGGRLGLAIRQYQSYEKANRQAYWESTHSFPILPASAEAYPWLTVYHKERNNRRSHAGNRWKGFLQVLIVAMQEGWCDLDILLDSFFLHFPRRHESVIWYPGYESRQANIKNRRLNRPEPTDLLEALDECNGADSWRNHYRDSPQDHPARQIARLTDKFFGVHTADAE
ncbi:uncharacterized protein IUM83_16470 [Phytophthora cinnamomi]|uniref:uncharacterized protein n=2 Tax=Phytophthora cinnamomi TaxID=4785 RepID=UPI003559D595|nr:hypothetical protein IUM83_16470 [Phytophthora cinnamomi]